MKYGLSDSAISKIQSVFARFPAIEKTVLYGSRAKGNYKPGSDIDLTLFGDDLTEKILGDVFFELDDLLLPYMIDLSIFEHIDNVNLREHIERVGVIFYEKMSESGWPGWKDKKDEDKSRNILKSSNPVNPDSDSGWEVKKLGEVCEFHNGQAHEKHIDEDGKYILVNSKFISSDGKKGKKTNSALSPLFSGDIVFVMSDVPNGKALGKCFLVDKNNKYTLNQRIGVIRSKVFKNEFLVYQFNRNEYLLSFNNGENQTNLRKNDILNCPLFLPPLLEQQRIVTILDKAFAAIAQAKANAEQNLKNAKELFESYLQSVFENRGEGWEPTRLGDICQINDGTHFSPKNTSDGTYMYITAKNIKPYFIDLTKISYVSEKDHKEIYARCSPVKGDVLYIKDGATAGVATLNTLDEEFSLLSSVALLKCSSKIINTFLVHYMNSAIGKKNFLGYLDGAAITRLTLVKIKSVCFSLPPRKCQEAIVQKLDTLSAQTKKLEALYQQKIKDLEELKKSILQKAFSGQLSESGFTGLEDLGISRDLSSSCPSSHPGHPDSDRCRQ